MILGRALAVVAAAAVAGCGSSSSSSSSITKGRPGVVQLVTRRMEVRSPAFAAGAEIPRAYTCDGRDISPPVRWSGIPRGTRELMLVMRDPDAPGGTFVHWALAGIPPTATGLAAGRPVGVPGRDSFGAMGYRGPCPPPGDHAHHYVITLEALARRSGLRRGFAVGAAPAGRVLGSGVLVGTYRR